MTQWESVVRGRGRQMTRPRLWMAAPVVLVALFVAIGSTAPVARAVAPLQSSPSLTIINPSGLKGPVGTNVTAKITGAHSGHTYNLAYAPASPGCTALGASSSSLPQVTVGSGGAVQFSFAWPADSGTGSFVLCAQDPSTPLIVVQSDQSFTVLSATPPAVSIQPAPQPTPTGTAAASADNGSDSGYTTGERVIVQGTGFLPGGTSVVIALSGSPDGEGNQISQGTVNADTFGSFTTTVTLPSFRIGNLYIQALTTDGGANQPPSLLASTPITIALAPTPTPLPSPTVTSTVAVTPTTPGGSTGGSSGNDGTLRILGIAGLGSFSVLLLLVGSALLISAGSAREEQS